MKHNLMFEDLEGALMLISFDTVDEDGVVERETLAYTYADGKLKPTQACLQIPCG